MHRLLVACVVLSWLVAACGGDLSGTCEDYLRSDEATQLELATKWAVKDAYSDSTRDFAAPQFRDWLLATCSTPGNRDTKLQNVPILGFERR